MREAVFIKKNAHRWEKLEAAFKEKDSLKTDEIAELYIGLNDDLSFARTHYPNSNTTRYLNELTAHFHRAIYKNKKERRDRLWLFWKREIPDAVYKSHKQLLAALVFFLVAVFIGAVSSANDPKFVNLILGDSYINTTNENIKNGDPMGIYGSMHNSDMFFAISTNNIYVSFLTYVFGIFFSAGTVFMLLNNGIMLGAFQYFFYERGLLITSMSAIYLHGALELSAIIIAGGAGLVLGNSILFPGTYSRKESLTEAANRSLKIIIGLVPVFILAAILESFVTRYYNKMPQAINWTIIISSMSFIIWYYIIYPIRINKTEHATAN